MEELISFQDRLINQLPKDWFRYLYHSIPKNERLIGIKGLRGVGKTTLILQYLDSLKKDRQSLYVTADHPYFYSTTLLSLAEEWDRLGGQLLAIDEIHKYPDWSRELKLIYDGFPTMNIIFTSSSALNLYKGESDLSRRLVSKSLSGLSFREYLSFNNILNQSKIEFQNLLDHHRDISNEITKRLKIIPHFRNYLRNGYFPFVKKETNEFDNQKIIQTINTVLETDLVHVQDYSASNVAKIKRLLGVIASSAPFEPNISSIAKKLHIGRDTVNQYLRHLAEAKIVILLNKNQRGISGLQKPDKIFLENTSFISALVPKGENVGTVRETFFINQMINSNHTVSLADKGDFVIDGKTTFEVGGRNKDGKQVKEIMNSYLALDDIENGLGNKIPLWLFGFLY